MKHTRIITAGVLSGIANLVSASPSPAASSIHDADLRCLAGFAIRAGETEGSAQTSAISGIFYFLGRLDAETPGFDMKAELTNLSRSQSTEQILSSIARCAAELQQRGRVLTEVGTALKNMQ